MDLARLAGNKTVLALRRVCDRHVGGIDPREGIPQALVDEIISNLPHGVLQAVLNPAAGADDDGVGLVMFIPLRQVEVVLTNWSSKGNEQIGYSCSEPFPWFAWGPRETAMRVNDLITKAVLFIGAKAEGHFIPVGTGFVALTPVSTDVAWQTIVTCKHVIDKIPGEIVYARINDRSGQAQLIGLPKKDWFCHPTDRRIDVAVYPSSLPKDQFDIIHFPINDFIQDDKNVVNVTLNVESIARFNVGIGDEVYLAGLFIGRVGDVANIPILRTGTIGAMSGEKIETQYGRHEAFLVEVRSIDGLSGSPVCVHLPTTRLLPPNIPWNIPVPMSLAGVTGYLLMGMVLGYNEVYNPEDVIEIKGRTDEPVQRMGIPLNTGIAVVLPIWTIIETMEQDAIKQKRKALLKRSNREKGRGFVATSAAPIAIGKVSPYGNPQHREDFTALLNAAVRKPQSKD